MIVVTAPTGNIGRKVVDDLLAVGAPLRLIVRDATRLDDAVREGERSVTGRFRSTHSRRSCSATA